MSASYLADDPAGSPIAVEHQAACYLCGSVGRQAHRGLRDRLFGAPGAWSLMVCSSRACGLFWLSPRPTRQEIGKAYAHYYTHSEAGAQARGPGQLYAAIRDGFVRLRYGYRRGVGPAARVLLAPLAYLYPTGAEEVKSSVMFLPAPAPGARLLDVGCGNGHILARMASLGWEVEGVELDPAAVAVARARGLQVRQGTLFEQGYPDDRFDAVILVHLIEHDFDPVALLRECRRILRPGGRLVLLTPNARGLGSVLFGPDWRGWEPPRHLFVFHPGTMARALREAGFQRARVRTIARGARYILTMSEVIRAARRGGRPAVAAVEPPRTRRGIAYQLTERALLLVWPSAGEEVLAVAERD